MAYETFDRYDPYDEPSYEGSGSGYATDPYDDVGPRRRRRHETIVRRAPTPGVAAVLSVLIPGLGQVYGGRLIAGALWFLATMFCYSAVLLPGFIVHALCVWSAYAWARDWRPPY